MLGKREVDDTVEVDRASVSRLGEQQHVGKSQPVTACISQAPVIRGAGLGKLMPCFKGGACCMMCCVGPHRIVFSLCDCSAITSNG